MSWNGSTRLCIRSSSWPRFLTRFLPREMQHFAQRESPAEADLRQAGISTVILSAKHIQIIEWAFQTTCTRLRRCFRIQLEKWPLLGPVRPRSKMCLNFLLLIAPRMKWSHLVHSSLCEHFGNLDGAMDSIPKIHSCLAWWDRLEGPLRHQGPKSILPELGYWAASSRACCRWLKLSSRLSAATTSHRCCRSLIWTENTFNLEHLKINILNNDPVIKLWVSGLTVQVIFLMAPESRTWINQYVLLMNHAVVLENAHWNTELKMVGWDHAIKYGHPNERLRAKSWRFFKMLQELWNATLRGTRGGWSPVKLLPLPRDLGHPQPQLAAVRSWQTQQHCQIACRAFLS